MDFLITWAIVLGLIVVPGLINYFANRYVTPPGTTTAPRLELIAASFSLTFAILVMDIMLVLLISLGWDDLKEEIADFVNLGLADFGRERPIALTGVLTAVSVGCMAVMALLGTARIPSRFLR